MLCYFQFPLTSCNFFFDIIPLAVFDFTDLFQTLSAAVINLLFIPDPFGNNLVEMFLAIDISKFTEEDKVPFTLQIYIYSISRFESF